MSSLTILVVGTKCADYLRVTLPRVKRVFPSAPVIVATTADDGETKAVCSVLRLQHLVQIDAAKLKENESTYNYAALVRAGQAKVKEVSGANTWTLLLHPQVFVDLSLGNIDFGKLDKTALYSSFFTELDTNAQVQAFDGKKPSKEDIDKFQLSKSLLLWHGEKLFDEKSLSAKHANDCFFDKFKNVYMIQSTNGYLGSVGADDEGRATVRWEERNRVQTDTKPAAPATPAPVPVKPVETSDKNDVAKQEATAQSTDIKPAAPAPVAAKPVETSEKNDVAKQDATLNCTDKKQEPKPNVAKSSSVKKLFGLLDKDEPIDMNGLGVARKASEAVTTSAKMEEEGIQQKLLPSAGRVQELSIGASARSDIDSAKTRTTNGAHMVDAASLEELPRTKRPTTSKNPWKVAKLDTL